MKNNERCHGDIMGTSAAVASDGFIFRYRQFIRCTVAFIPRLLSDFHICIPVIKRPVMYKQKLPYLPPTHYSLEHDVQLKQLQKNAIHSTSPVRYIDQLGNSEVL